jgi:hypothetical protein
VHGTGRGGAAAHLRHAADHRETVDGDTGVQLAVGAHDRVGRDPATVADAGIGFENRKLADVHICTQFGGRVHAGGRVDHGGVLKGEALVSP